MQPNAKYLGLPIFIHKNKKKTFEDIRAEVLNRLSAGWKAKTLAQATRAKLIKSVAFAMPSFSMSMFLFPSSFCLPN
jgi:hypothetical protein